MSKATRMLAMAGMALVAGATIGAGPAAAVSASSTTTQGTAASTQSAQQQAKAPRDRIVGYYRTLRQCERAGRIGEWRDRWDDYDCERVRWGHRRGLWALEAQWDWNWNNNNGGHHGNNDNNGWPHGNNNNHGGGHHGGGHGW